MSPRRAIAWSLAILLIGGLVGWAIAVATRPPQSVAEEAKFVLVTAVDGDVSQSVATVVTARWPVSQVAVNQSSGTLTRLLVSRGEQVRAGDVLYRVDERPVALLEGKVPAFRPLSVGAVGADVAQLTRFLVARKHLNTVSSRYSLAVQRAVRSWQASMGVKQTGRLGRGDVIFVKSLPVRIALGSSYKVGAQLSAGSPAIEALADEPNFVAEYSEFQAKQVSEGMSIRVEFHSRLWNGTLGPLTVAEDGTVTAAVTATANRVLCGDQCGDVPLRGTTQLKGVTAIQEIVRGVVVPAAALITDADGSTAVITADGQRRSVTVRARARGMAVVDGLAGGTSVRVPGQ